MTVEYIRYQIPDDHARAFDDAYHSADSSLKEWDDRRRA
jgi:hypothetical protein